MEILHQAGYVILLSILSGVFGRMGGAGGKYYRTWMRDWICPLIAFITLWLLGELKSCYWLAYLISYILMGFSLTTYYDTIFGKDNFWVSGDLCGVAFLPLVFTGIIWQAILLRAIVLAIIWGSLNKYLPSKVLIWRRDVAEEFLRYASVVLTLYILLMR